MPNTIGLDTLLAPAGNENAYYTDQMRAWRDALLAESDWTQMPDSPLTDSKKAEWATYRQQLRDFPETWSPADTVNFPDKPS